MFEKISNSLNSALKKLRGVGTISELNINNTIKEIRTVLVQSDVNYKVAKKITEDIKNNSIGKKVLESISPRELFIKVFHESITELMGSESKDLNIKGSPAVILLCGLQGAGKTTLSVKLAKMLSKKGKECIIAACDVYRPAAIEQLKIFAKGSDIEVYSEDEEKNVQKIAKGAIDKAKSTNKSIVIIDTAGRLSIDEKMMEEISFLKENFSPSEILFVVDSMIGQDSVNTAKVFYEKLQFSGVVLTKLDGDSKGGVALSIVSSVGVPIKFISNGEKVDDFSVFYPERIANRILGMGDVVSLVERAEEIFKEKENELLEKKKNKNKFDYEVFLSQIKSFEKIGDPTTIASMLPIGAIDGDNFKNTIKNYKAIIESMTPKERKAKQQITKKRVEKIAIGSGNEVSYVLDFQKKMEKLKLTVENLMKNGNYMQFLKGKFGF